jgi:hypothetical protein
MLLVNQARCRKCGRGMDEVATIPAIGGMPGLIAFLCGQCGKGESVVIHPAQGRHRGRSDTSENSEA